MIEQEALLLRALDTFGDVATDLQRRAEMETTGTGRWWSFTGRRWILSPLNRAFEWHVIDESPYNP